MDFPPCGKSYPHFNPHITLASGIPPSIDVASILACIPDVPSLPVEFKSLEIGDTYYRSVYIAIHASSNLSALHQSVSDKLRKLEGVQPRSPCFPHMSLYYIDEAEPGERHKVADELLHSGRVVKIKEGDRDGIILDCSADSREVKLSGFDGEEIWVVTCEGPVEQWKTLGKVDLLIQM
jgi:2'-5' RNA ligase